MELLERVIRWYAHLSDDDLRSLAYLLTTALIVWVQLWRDYELRWAERRHRRRVECWRDGDGSI